MQLGVTK